MHDSLYGLACRFIESQKWCASVLNATWERGFKHFGVFKVEIEPTETADPVLWVIVGDTSPAYFDLQSCPTAKSAVEAYVFWLREWAAAIRSGGSLEDVMPIYTSDGEALVVPNDTNARLAEQRAAFFEENFTF